MKRQNLSKIEKICYAYIICILTFFLLFTGRKGYADITTPKLIAFWAISGIFLITCAILVFTKRQPIDYKSFITDVSPAQICVVAYLLFTIISSLISDYTKESLIGMSRGEGLITISLYCLIFLIISNVQIEDKKLLIVFTISFLIFELICLIQFKGFNPFDLYPQGYNYNDANVDYYGAYIGTLGNVDIASSFIAPATALLLTASFRTEGKFRIVTIIAAAIGIYIIFKIGVKSGILGFIVGIYLLTPFILRLKANDKRKLCIILMLILIIALIMIFLIDVQHGMLHELHQLMHGNFNPDFGTGRIKIWTAVLNKMPHHILFGYGPDTMIAANIDPWESHIEKYDLDYYAYIDAAHNEYLNVLFHQGILAMIAFIGAIAFPIINTLKSKSLSSSQIILLSFVVVYSIQAFFNISMCLVAPFFWIALALLSNKKSAA